jgi:hypothetical protein
LSLDELAQAVIYFAPFGILPASDALLDVDAQIVVRFIKIIIS